MTETKANNAIIWAGRRKKKMASLSDTHRDDGHLEFLEIRRISGDYLGTRERNQSIIRLLSCFSSLFPPSSSPVLSLSLSRFSLAREAPFTGYLPDGNFPPVALITAISVRLTIIISWYPIDDGPRRRAAVPSFFFPSLKSNNVIHLSRLHSLRVLIVSTATDE